MIKLLVRIAINAVALYAAVNLVPGLQFERDSNSLLIIALIFGVVNGLVRPVLVLLTCPLIVLTLGLFVLVINTIMLSITVWLSGPEVWDLGLTSTGFWATFFGAIVISVVSGLMNIFVKDDNERDKRSGSHR